MRLRQALRALRASPGITIASVVILALGIGASTAVFSVVNAMLLRPLPVTAQDRLLRIWKNDVERGVEHYALLYPEYLEWSRRSQSFESLAAVWSWGTHEGLLLGSSEPVRLEVLTVSGNVFDVLGVSSHVGRTLRSEDDRATALPPLVLSYRVWRERFGSDPTVVGKTLPLRLGERTSFQVVGVMPEAFHLFAPAEAWSPIMAVHPEWAGNQACECDLIGRLASGVTAAQALAELQTIDENMASERPDEYRSTPVVFVPFLESVVGDFGHASLLAFAAVALILAIAIANVAALSLIRALGRTREVLIRSALGAGTASLLRERLTESALLAAAALAGGFVLSHFGIELLLVLKGADLPRVQEIGIDARALLFGTAVAALATAICASLPMISGTRESLRSRRFASQGRIMQGMVVSEIALALPLLFTSGLLVRTLRASGQIDRGFESENLLTLEMPLPVSKYSETASRLAFFEELVRQVESLGGVASVTTLRMNPGSGDSGVTGPLAYEGQLPEEARDNPMTNIEMVTPSYFAVLGIPIVQGRPFDRFDRLDSERVAIVSAEVAATYWPGQDPIGKMVGYEELRHRVVGVAGNTRYRELTRSWPTVYFPIHQNPFSAERKLHPLLSLNVLAVRTRLSPESLVSSIRSAVRSLDPELPLDRIAMMDDLLDLELRTPRFHAVFTSSFSFVALLLAAAGVYSVFAAFVAQRLPELGIRSALGATPARLRSLVLNRSRNLVLTGIVVGGIAAWWLSRFLGGFLYGVSPFDVPTFLETTALLAVASLAATVVPARRAARVDPLSLLKQE
ncbi:MAG TPA: ABC transporter permease [Vicinamibacteria bacterium]|nr:ABC transporter permease [Vicinamibacteria bacterium]